MMRSSRFGTVATCRVNEVRGFPRRLQREERREESDAAALDLGFGLFARLAEHGTTARSGCKDLWHQVADMRSMLEQRVRVLVALEECRSWTGARSREAPEAA